jgi:hypothetical protein
MQLEEVLGFVKQLSLVDKVRLIERVAPEIERDLKTTQKMSKQSLFLSKLPLTAIRWLFLPSRWLKLCISASVGGFHLKLWLSC